MESLYINMNYFNHLESLGIHLSYEEWTTTCKYFLEINWNYYEFLWVITNYKELLGSIRNHCGVTGLLPC